jgi:hypothetical protein
MPSGKRTSSDPELQRLYDEAASLESQAKEIQGRREEVAHRILAMERAVLGREKSQAAPKRKGKGK